MWKAQNGELVQMTDDSRVIFRTSVSKQVLNELQLLAEEHYTHVNYLIENGLQNMLEQNAVCKKTKAKDRIEYKTTYDRVLLDSAKKYAEEQHVYMRDMIELSIHFIKIEDVKSGAHRYRIE